MKYPPITLKTAKQLDHAKEVVGALPVGDKKPLVVRITETPVLRSEAQKGLWFMWCGIIGKELEGSKDAYHDRHKKETFLRMFLQRPDTEEEPNHHLFLHNQAIKALHAGDDRTGKRFYAALMNYTTTNQATAEEFTNALRTIEAEAVFANIALPYPDDFARLALGEK